MHVILCVYYKYKYIYIYISNVNIKTLYAYTMCNIMRNKQINKHISLCVYMPVYAYNCGVSVYISK